MTQTVSIESLNLVNGPEWAKCIAAEYVNSDKHNRNPDLVADMFHAVVILSRSVTDKDELAKMFGTKRCAINLILHIYPKLTPEVFELTHSSVPLGKRLLISEAHLVGKSPRDRQLQAATNLITGRSSRRPYGK